MPECRLWACLTPAIIYIHFSYIGPGPKPYITPPMHPKTCSVTARPTPIPPLSGWVGEPHPLGRYVPSGVGFLFSTPPSKMHNLSYLFLLKTCGIRRSVALFESENGTLLLLWNRWGVCCGTRPTHCRNELHASIPSILNLCNKAEFAITTMNLNAPVFSEPLSAQVDKSS